MGRILIKWLLQLIQVLEVRLRWEAIRFIKVNPSVSFVRRRDILKRCFRKYPHLRTQYHKGKARIDPPMVTPDVDHLTSRIDQHLSSRMDQPMSILSSRQTQNVRPTSAVNPSAMTTSGNPTAFHAKSASAPPTWVIDSGANDHMTGTGTKCRKETNQITRREAKWENNIACNRLHPCVIDYREESQNPAKHSASKNEDPGGLYSGDAELITNSRVSMKP